MIGLILSRLSLLGLAHLLGEAEMRGEDAHEVIALSVSLSASVSESMSDVHAEVVVVLVVLDSGVIAVEVDVEVDATGWERK